MTNDLTRFKDYLSNKEMWSKTLCRITKDGCYWFLNGQWITHNTFRKMYPLEIRPKQSSLDNPCKKPII